MFKPFKFKSFNDVEYTININQITHIEPEGNKTLITLSCGTKLSCGFSVGRLLEEFNQKLS